MSDTMAAQKGLDPWASSAALRWRVASPMKWDRPVFAIPKLLERVGMTVDDIDLWGIE